MNANTFALVSYLSKQWIAYSFHSAPSKPKPKPRPTFQSQTQTFEQKLEDIAKHHYQPTEAFRKIFMLLPHPKAHKTWDQIRSLKNATAQYREMIRVRIYSIPGRRLKLVSDIPS